MTKNIKHRSFLLNDPKVMKNSDKNIFLLKIMKFNPVFFLTRAFVYKFILFLKISLRSVPSYFSSLCNKYLLLKIMQFRDVSLSSLISQSYLNIQAMTKQNNDNTRRGMTTLHYFPSLTSLIPLLQHSINTYYLSLLLFPYHSHPYR